MTFLLMDGKKSDEEVDAILDDIQAVGAAEHEHKNVTVSGGECCGG